MLDWAFIISMWYNHNQSYTVWKVPGGREEDIGDTKPVSDISLREQYTLYVWLDFQIKVKSTLFDQQGMFIHNM